MITRCGFGGRADAVIPWSPVLGWGAGLANRSGGDAWSVHIHQSGGRESRPPEVPVTPEARPRNRAGQVNGNGHARGAGTASGGLEGGRGGMRAAGVCGMGDNEGLRARGGPPAHGAIGCAPGV